MADPIGWIAEGKPAENEAFMVFGKRTEYACVPVYAGELEDADG